MRILVFCLTLVTSFAVAQTTVTTEKQWGETVTGLFNIFLFLVVLVLVADFADPVSYSTTFFSKRVAIAMFCLFCR
jgi:hypothetical protein